MPMMPQEAPCKTTLPCVNMDIIQIAVLKIDLLHPQKSFIMMLMSNFLPYMGLWL